MCAPAFFFSAPDGNVKDTTDLRQRKNLGVVAVGTNAEVCVSSGDVQAGVDVTFNAATFRQGDYVYADQDGVIVSRQPLASFSPAKATKSSRDLHPL